MSQTHRQTLVETIASTAIGFVVAYIATYVVMPWFGHEVTHAQNVGITSIFTVISIVRGYAIRRFFNWLHGRAAVSP